MTRAQPPADIGRYPTLMIAPGNVSTLLCMTKQGRFIAFFKGPETTGLARLLAQTERRGMSSQKPACAL
jgi:hypothetical protein